jgi:hypothetical protein
LVRQTFVEIHSTKERAPVSGARFSFSRCFAGRFRGTAAAAQGEAIFNRPGMVLGSEIHGDVAETSMDLLPIFHPHQGGAIFNRPSDGDAGVDFMVILQEMP